MQAYLQAIVVHDAVVVVCWNIGEARVVVCNRYQEGVTRVRLFYLHLCRGNTNVDNDPIGADM